MTKKRQPAKKGLVRREMTYDKELYAALVERKEKTGVDITEQVRRAIERELSFSLYMEAPQVPLGEEFPKQKEVKENRFGFRLNDSLAERFREYSSETGIAMTEIIEQGIELVLSGQRLGHSQPRTRNTLMVPLSQPVHDRFNALAETVGYNDPDQLAKDLVLAAANNPRGAHDFLFGELEAESLAAVLAREEAPGEDNEEVAA